MSSSFSAILFDLDGTLLQVDMPAYIRRYVAGYYTHCKDLVEFDPLQRAMRAGIRLLLETEDGTLRNEERLFTFLAGRLQLSESLLRARFADFLLSGVDALAAVVKPIPMVTALLESCRLAGIPLALATNPVFPRTLIEARCRWVGLDADDFSLLTCFENSYYCKPQAGYFQEVAGRLGVDPKTCLMVGNDTCHDLAATRVGMTTWLLEPFLIERDGPKWEPDHRGTHQQLHDYLRKHL
ncbi:HAD family hydrolase [Geopsychrobacter electrodiphilus]|uniref:HAD family hydrolase n=1 Tax=Geopsychrobacter electrodiphilus TaxID=225196 RepID=UPI0003684013|nr:HAD family hydrolase [Geopsychrobacter electrodiphilus]